MQWLNEPDNCVPTIQWLNKTDDCICEQPIQQKHFHTPGVLLHEGNWKEEGFSKEKYPNIPLPKGDIWEYFDCWPNCTCAIVGSAGLALYVPPGTGKFIDSHDIIFRANAGPFTGYEEAVGSRTDIRCTCHRDSHCFVTTGEETGKVIPRDGGPEFWRLWDSNKTLMNGKLKETVMWSTTAAFRSRCTNFLRTYGTRLAQPSASFWALCMAFPLCHTIDIFGADMYSCLEEKYYFNSKDNDCANDQGEFGSHSFQAERNALLTLSMERNLTMMPGTLNHLPNRKLIKQSLVV